MLTWISRVGRRLKQAVRQRTWALVSARAEGISIRTLATAIGLSPGRGHRRRPAIYEASWLRQCSRWLAHPDPDSCPPAVNLRPAADWPDRASMAAGLTRVAAVTDRIAADVDELARARRVQDLTTAVVLHDPRAERRRRLAEPYLEFRAQVRHSALGETHVELRVWKKSAEGRLAPFGDLKVMR